MDLLPHTHPAQGDAGIMVPASSEGMHAFIRAAPESHLGLLGQDSRSSGRARGRR